MVSYKFDAPSCRTRGGGVAVCHRAGLTVIYKRVCRFVSWFLDSTTGVFCLRNLKLPDLQTEPNPLPPPITSHTNRTFHQHDQLPDETHQRQWLDAASGAHVEPAKGGQHPKAVLPTPKRISQFFVVSPKRISRFSDTQNGGHPKEFPGFRGVTQKNSLVFVVPPKRISRFCNK